MQFLRKQSGASLLIILLIMAGAGAVVLVGSKAIIDSSRQVSATANNTLALQMAQTGVQDGLLLYKKGFLSQSGEYGDTTAVGGYSLQPMRRGFSDASCKVYGLDQLASATATTYNPDCPYYDVTIRNTIAMTSATTNWSLTTRELPNNIATVIPLENNPALTFSLDALPGLTYDYGVCTTYNCSAPSDPVAGIGVTGSSNPAFQISALTGGGIPIKALRFTAHYSLSAGPHVGVIGSVAPQSLFPTQVAVGKGYTTIDVTGYAGGVQKKVVVTIRNHDKLTLNSPEINPSYNELDFTGTFNQYGVLIP